MKQHKAIFNWSGGKDSALALYHILNDEKFDVTQLVTTVNSKFNRISMHGVRNELLTAQGKEIGLPIQRILLPETPSMEDYDAIMKRQLIEINKQKITHSIFGDIFLEDLRTYRETRLKEVGLQGYFPLWKRNTTELVNEFIDLGFKTMIVCCKAELLGSEFTGRVIDKELLKDLPKNVDPCGENGEFHTFVFDGPIFKNPIQFKIGEKTYKEYEISKDDNSKKESGFHFCDLIPV
ncbi:diphthine--ammonia ligase [Lutibacter holmesii]|uniref:Diphthine--ammonia ligase n=1 Tax=Lutibacter holmesii TaxID=1137985 RepID=A0ABW3WQK4_9FLAO